MFGQIGFKLRKEGLDDLGLSEGFAKQPDRLGIGDALSQIEPQEPHEGQTVTDLVLSLLIGQVIQGLQDEDFEHQHGIKGGGDRLVSAWSGEALVPRPDEIPPKAHGRRAILKDPRGDSRPHSEWQGQKK